MKLLLFVLFLPLLSPSPCRAEPLQVMPDLTLHLQLPAGWEQSRQPPEFLVTEMAEHADDAVVAKARQAGISDRREMAQRMLAANELFIFNPQSGAHLEIDFSPLKPGEKAPSRRTLKQSAQFAGESLANEEGISAVRSAVEKVRISGAEGAYRLDAEFLRDGRPTRFVGLIGFVAPYWFFAYYTDPLRDAKDLAAARQMLDALRLEKTEP